MFKRILISNFAIGKTYNFIENTQRIPHAAFAFLSNNMQGGFFCLYIFFIAISCRCSTVSLCGDAFKIKYLATG